MEEKLEAPPIGVMPRWLWLEQNSVLTTESVTERAAAIRDAVVRFRDAKKPIPLDWISEYEWCKFILAN